MHELDAAVGQLVEDGHERGQRGVDLQDLTLEEVDALDGVVTLPENTSISTSWTSFSRPAITGSYESTTWSVMAWSTALGPHRNSSGWCSESLRTRLRGDASP